MAQRVALAPPEPKFVLRDGMGPVSCIDFGLEDVLYAGTQDGWIHIWDLTINRRRTSFQVGQSVCLAVRALPNKLITQTKGEVFAIRAISGTYEVLYQLNCPYIGFCSLVLNYNMTVAFVPREDSGIMVIHLERHNIVTSLSQPSEKVGEVMVIKFFNLRGLDLLLVGYESGNIFLWNVDQSIVAGCIKIENVPMAIDFDEENCRGVCGTEGDCAILFRLEEDFRFTIQKPLQLKNPGVSAVFIRPDKKICILGCWDGNLRVYSWKSGRILAVLSEHLETVQALSYSPHVIKMWNSVILAAGSKDRTISLWSFY